MNRFAFSTVGDSRTPMRIIGLLVFATLMATRTEARAQESESAQCYRFNWPFFWRMAWHHGAQTWTRDTTSIVALTSVPHPRNAIARETDWRRVIAFMPMADSVWGGPANTASWRALSRDSIALDWF